MAIVRVHVRRVRYVVDVYECEVPDGLTDEEVRDVVEREYAYGEIVDTENLDYLPNGVMRFDFIERVKEGDQQS